MTQPSPAQNSIPVETSCTEADGDKIEVKNNRGSEKMSSPNSTGHRIALLPTPTKTCQEIEEEIAAAAELSLKNETKANLHPNPKKRKKPKKFATSESAERGFVRQQHIESMESAQANLSTERSFEAESDVPVIIPVKAKITKKLKTGAKRPKKSVSGTSSSGQPEVLLGSEAKPEIDESRVQAATIIDENSGLSSKPGEHILQNLYLVGMLRCSCGSALTFLRQ